MCSEWPLAEPASPRSTSDTALRRASLSSALVDVQNLIMSRFAFDSCVRRVKSRDGFKRKPLNAVYT